MFDCCVVRFVSPFSEKKSNFQSGQKSRENRTNMDIIISFVLVAEPVDKHGITLVHITYPPLGIYLPAVCKPQRVACNVNNQSSSSGSESQESGITSGMSPKIFKELTDNVKEPFPLHMSSWQRDFTRFRTVFTGHDGETLLSPHTFAELDTLADELFKSISISTG